jgi:putative N-acetyltransferase (TIGR04045 family)
MYQIAYREAPATADGSIIAGPRALRAVPRPDWWVEPAEDPETVADYRALRRDVFVDRQGLFVDDDADEVDADPRTVVLVARGGDGTVLGGVRLGPATAGEDIGWWHGGRLVVRPPTGLGVGADLVRAACRYAVSAGALRFEADIQARNEDFFVRLGWRRAAGIVSARAAHLRMRWPIDRIAALAAATKAPLGGLLHGMHLGGAGFVGDDGAPVPTSDLVAVCDAVLPAMVARDPWWAGWCSVLVNLNDLAAMGARPLGLLDAVGAPDVATASAVLDGLREAAARYDVPVLGGHSTLGVPEFLAVTALGRAAAPVPGGGGRPGHQVRLTVDTAGEWRPGYVGRQWDSTSMRTTAELGAMLASVATGCPAAAKDVSMAGLVGTLGMLAEASGVGAVLDVAAVPRPAGVAVGDWFTCFPGFAMLTAEPDGHPAPPAGPAVSAVCGRLDDTRGVRLRWPDGELTTVIEGPVTGLGPALTDSQIPCPAGTSAWPS